MASIISGIKLTLKEFLFVIHEDIVNQYIDNFFDNEYDEILNGECKYLQKIFIDFLCDFRKYKHDRNFNYYLDNIKYKELNKILIKFLFYDVFDYYADIGIYFINDYKMKIFIIGDILRFNKNITELNLMPTEKGLNLSSSRDGLNYIIKYNESYDNIKKSFTCMNSNIINIITLYTKLNISKFEIKHYFVDK